MNNYIDDMKKAYKNHHDIIGDYKISFYTQKEQKNNIVHEIITNMLVYCNNIDVLKNKNNNFLYEYCYNSTKKYKKYKYVIYIKYNKADFYYLFKN